MQHWAILRHRHHRKALPSVYLRILLFHILSWLEEIGLADEISHILQSLRHMGGYHQHHHAWSVWHNIAQLGQYLLPIQHRNVYMHNAQLLRYDAPEGLTRTQTPRTLTDFLSYQEQASGILISYHLIYRIFIANNNCSFIHSINSHQHQE